MCMYLWPAPSPSPNQKTKRPRNFSVSSYSSIILGFRLSFRPWIPQKGVNISSFESLDPGPGENTFTSSAYSTLRHSLAKPTLELQKNLNKKNITQVKT